MVSYGESDDTLMQRILEESLKDANVRRHNDTESSAGMNDSMDEVLLAKALEDSLSFNKHSSLLGSIDLETDKNINRRKILSFLLDKNVVSSK